MQADDVIGPRCGKMPGMSSQGQGTSLGLFLGGLVGRIILAVVTAVSIPPIHHVDLDPCGQGSSMGPPIQSRRRFDVRLVELWGCTHPPLRSPDGFTRTTESPKARSLRVA